MINQEEADALICGTNGRYHEHFKITEENLGTGSTYGNEDIFGPLVGFGLVGTNKFIISRRKSR